MNEERWKKHPEFQEYEISTHGRVRHIKYLALCVGVNGYAQVSLGKDHKKNVHALVMETFVGARPSGNCVRHVNGKRSDNRLDNLAYGSYPENAYDRIAHGTNNHGSNHAKAKLNERQVLDIRRRCSAGEFTGNIAKDFSVSPGLIRMIVNRRRWRHV